MMLNVITLVLIQNSSTFVVGELTAEGTIWDSEIQLTESSSLVDTENPFRMMHSNMGMNQKD